MERLLAVLRRYQPLVLTLTAITLIAFLLPDSEPATVPTPVEGASGIQGAGAAEPTDGASVDASKAGAGRGGVGSAAVQAGTVTLEEAKAKGLEIDFGPNCDTGTERIKVPSRYAPPCVARFSGSNGGATAKGVTDKTINIVVYRPEPDPAADAIIQAAGANDSTEDVQATYKDWKTYFESHYETYGRKVVLKFIRGSGPSDDDAAARADAKTADLDLHAFAVWAHVGAPAAFVDELAARGIISITGSTQPTKFYLDRAPYGWGVQLNEDQAFIHTAEYIGKRLVRKKARWAGTAVVQQQTRSFGLIYTDNEQQTSKSAVDSFARELAKYGAKLVDRVPIRSDPTAAQEQARPIIQRFKEKGITSVVYNGSALVPIFLTQESTRQQYFPEWVMTGGNLVDTTFFGRTYDQTQWSHAFGVSQLWVRPPKQRTEPWYQHEWQHCRAPTAVAEYEIIYQPELIFYTGVHLAGPVLNAQTFRDALFEFPSPPVGVSSIHRSFGRHGIWSTDDYGAFDDTTEVWWDSDEVGQDEIEKTGRGMYRYVSGGKRYLPGSWPRTEPKAFVLAGTVTKLDDLPGPDRFPRYEDKHCK
ncbi:MAG TPA: hypothetical protein VFA34_10985 [Actinomycetota bacterium]|jgi:hypothetical protein|nr:hypothetical protein [Actinomycetota bacterium]